LGDNSETAFFLESSNSDEIDFWPPVSLAMSIAFTKALFRTGGQGPCHALDIFAFCFLETNQLTRVIPQVLPQMFF
jgi:hypothetical protein